MAQNITGSLRLQLEYGKYLQGFSYFLVFLFKLIVFWVALHRLVLHKEVIKRLNYQILCLKLTESGVIQMVGFVLDIFVWISLK